MNKDSPDDEWELSKENVQPLRQGRRLSSLNAGLRGSSGCDDHRIKEERHMYEAELRTYSGDDPIDVWYRYIVWTEQAYPKGGPESNLPTLLERCAREFKDQERYRNDERLAYVCMKLAEMCSEPLEIYNFMFDQNIACELSCFYEGWASLLEQLGNYKKADEVYMTGLRKNARPYERLKNKHKNFEMRLGRHIMSEVGSQDPEASSQESEQRQVLSKLHTIGKKKQAPVARVGSAIQGSAGVLSGARPKAQSSSNARIQIYSDENAGSQSGTSLPAGGTGQWSDIPKQGAMNKENTQKAGIWTKQKTKSKVNVPIADVNRYNPLPFNVHVDEDNKQALRTPAKMPELGNKVLSSRKEDKSSSTQNCLATMTAGHKENAGERVMYCKTKVYAGIEEFSLEELRAIAWFRDQEKQKQEQESKQMQDQWQKLEQERQQLLEERERVRQQRLQIAAEEKAMLEETRRKRHEFHQKLQVDRDMEERMVTDSIQARLQEQARTETSTSTSSSGPATSARQLVFDAGSHGNTENIAPQSQMMEVLTQPVTNSASSGSVSSAGNRSLNSSRTPTSFNASMQKLTESFEKTMSGAPSPTVNMKEAMCLVRGLFNGSLDMDKSVAQMQEQPSLPQTRGGGLPFQIFDESNKPPSQSRNQPMSANPSTSTAPFPVFQDTVSTQNSIDRPASKSVSSAPFPVFQDSATSQAPPAKSFSVFQDAVCSSNQGQSAQSIQKQQSGQGSFTVFQDSSASVGKAAGNQQGARPKVVGAGSFTIYQDQAPSSGQSNMVPGGFSVFQDEPADSKMNQSQNVSMRRRKPSDQGETRDTGRALSLTRPLFDEDIDNIQAHARDDITLAPIGSHLSFAEAARFASTPFNPNSSGSGVRKGLDDSDIDMPGPVASATEQANMSGIEFDAEQPIDMKTDKLTAENHDQTAENNVSSNSFRKNLSPIMEGSTEDSGANSKHPLYHTTLESLSGKKQLTPVQDQTETTMNSLLGTSTTSSNHSLHGNKHSSTHTGSNDHSLMEDENSPEDDDYNQPTNVIDMSTYIPPEENDQTSRPASIMLDKESPFESRERILASLTKPLSEYDSYTKVQECMPQVRVGSILPLGFQVYEVKEKVGEGGYAKVFLVENSDDMFPTDDENYEVMKVEQPAQEWEYYICTELHQRLAKLHAVVDVRPAVMQINSAFFFNNGSILVSEYKPFGTLLDLVNKSFRNHRDQLPNLEPVMVFMAIELMHIVENIHRCQIIHSDIKPDNFLVLQFPTLPESSNPDIVFAGGSRFVQLIDFGQSIDMSKYPSGTTFMSKSYTECFQCIEMQTNRPWTYQTDLFGLAGTIHVLIHGHYMKVYQEAGIWKTSTSPCRNWNKPLWKHLFHTLLNVPSCNQLPDLGALRREFELYFVESLLPLYNKKSKAFNKTVCED